MKCRFCQNPLEEDCDFCSFCGQEVVSTRKIVLCTGKKKNGSICGAELQKGKNFCKKCGAKVDQSFFEKEIVVCANCGHAFSDDEDFCVDCGFPRNGISDTLPASTDEDSAALSSITKIDPPPPSGLVLGQKVSIGYEVYKRSQTTPQNNDLNADNKCDPPDKDIDRKTKEKMQTGDVQIENQPVANIMDDTTSVESNISPGKIEKMSYNEVCLEKKSESELESESIVVNERFAVDRVAKRELIETGQKWHSEGNDNPEKYENADPSSSINEEEEEKNENVSELIGNEKLKEISQEQHAKGDGVDENGAHTSQIRTSDSLEKEVLIEAMHSTFRQMEEKLDTEKMGTSGNTINSAEKESEKRASVEEPNENYADKKPTQETKPTADPCTPKKEVKKGSINNSNSSDRKETFESSKFDQNESDGKAKSRKENQICDAPIEKTHGTKSECEEEKSQTSTMKQKPEGKGSNITRTGIKGKNSGVVRIHFHSLVSAEFGLTSRGAVIVRFDVDELGGWQSDTHRPKLVRKYGDEYTEFKLVLDIPKRLFPRSRQIQYKYVVATDKAQKDKDANYVWEYYGTSATANRTLDLPDIKNIVHQYDGIVFPKPGEGWWNTVKNFFKGDIKERVQRDLVQSIEYFLPKFFKDLSEGLLPEMSVDEALNQLDELLHSLQRVYSVDWACYSKLSDYKRKISDIILQPMLKSFEDVLPCKEDPAESKRKMLRATTVVSVLGNFNLELYQKEEELLARGLLVCPSQKTRVCHDLDCIEKYFSKEGKKELSDFLISFIDSMAKRAENPMIFFCMPLHHFLTGALKPFDRVPEDCSYNDKVQKWWGTKYLSKAIDIFKKGPHSKWTMNLDQVVGILYPMFEMDYLLPRTFMAMLKLDEVGDAIKTGKIPFEVCAAILTFYVRTTRPGLPSSVASYEEKNVGDAIFALRDVCRVAVQKPDESSRTELIKHRMFYKIAGALLKETLGSSMQFLVTGAVQIFLHAVAAYDVIQKNQSSEKPNTLKQSDHLNILKVLCGDVRRWHVHYLKDWKASLESSLKCWDTIFVPNDLPSEAVKEDWNSDAEKDLNQILRREILQDTSGTNLLIELYCRKVETFHPCVQNCLNQLAFKAIETGYSAQMHRLESHERERFGRLLSSLYEREWEAAMKRRDMEDDRIILQHILTWTPFSHFLKMFYGDEKKVYHLSQLCIQELTQAISVIDQKMHALENGTVTLKDLSVIKDGENKFQELIMIMFEKSEKQILEKFNVARAVKIRQIEVDSYLLQKKYVATLVQLCQRIHSVQISELDKTIRQLDKKKDHLCVRDICQPTDVETATIQFRPHITVYKLSAEVISMLEPLHASYRSNIFLNLWQDIGRESKATTLDEVCKKVWKPAISKREEITKKLVNGEIVFAKMEKYLGDIYRDNEEKMVEEMMLVNVPDVTARERVKQLKQFRQMEARVNTAKTILKVAKAYELLGDFEVIKTIASQENAAYKKMKEFDDSLLKTCKFLEDLTSEKINCLDHFVICKHLVIWLRESMIGGVKELKVFVDLASISAGEGDIEIAKVNCLHAATTGYASLIFDLDENSGYKELLEKCQILWKELKADPNLSMKLLDTSRHLDWLKTVKHAHGSVEVTSLAQTEAINSKGIFCVGALNTAMNTSLGLYLQNTLQLTVPDYGKEFQGHRQYTFAQLQDLQSHLMLVAGKTEQGKNDVDRFMLVFDSVMRLANVFIKLNLAGCVLFKHWQTKFLCDPSRPVCAFIEFGQGAKPLKGRKTQQDDVTTVIPKIARFMENCLDKWIGHINQKRSEYLELNYFTTDQLVILQQEMVNIGPNKGVNIRIYPLLSAVKENCTYEDLVDAMKKASKDVVIKKFIAEMIRSGHSEKLAEAALRHVKPDQITEGISWCNDHLEEEATLREEDIEMGDGDHIVKEAIPYEGWKRSDQSVMSIAAAILNKLEVAKRDMDVDPLITDLEVLWEEFLTSVSSSVTDYLSVEHLGLILRRLAEKDTRQFNRPFPRSFVPGTPNLILCPKADVLSTVLSIYIMDSNQPLPQADEVLMCTPQTTLDQLDVFWRRTVADTSSKIHCIVNSDLLDFEVSDHWERQLEQDLQDRKHHNLQYKLVVVCRAENEYKSRIITALDRFRRPPLPIPDIDCIADYVRRKLQVTEGNSAAAVDFDNSCVRVVKSWRAGVGKSLYVNRRNEELTQQYPRHRMTCLVNIPLQDKEINVSQVTQILLTHILPPGTTTPRIFHLDIAHEVQEGVDFFLFSLLILGCLTDMSGYVWRRSPRDLYLIETMPIVELIQARKGGIASYIHHVFDFLPFLTCRSPQESLDILSNRQKPRDFKVEDPQFDLKKFKGHIFQRTYQYLSRLDQGRVTNDVDPTVPQGKPADCLKVLLRHCGVPNPSWAELHHFVWFLNTQLRDFERSSFCSATVADYLPGFSKFVLRFLIQMSRV